MWQCIQRKKSCKRTNQLTVTQKVAVRCVDKLMSWLHIKCTTRAMHQAAQNPRAAHSRLWVTRYRVSDRNRGSKRSKMFDPVYDINHITYRTISADPSLSGGARLEVMCFRHLADEIVTSRPTTENCFLCKEYRSSKLLSAFRRWRSAF